MRDLARRDFWTVRIPLWRVVIIVLVLGTIPGAGSAYVLSNRIEDSSHAADVKAQAQIRSGCERTNALRRLLNTRAAAVRVLQKGVIDFMAQARRARMNPNGTSYDPQLADQYERDISKVASVPDQKLPVVDCDRAFHFTSLRPAGPAGRATATLLP